MNMNYLFKILTNRTFCTISSIAIIGVSAYLSHLCKDSSLVARSSALLVLLGIFLTSKETLTTDYEEMVADRKSAGINRFPHANDPNAEGISKKIEDEAREIISSNILGFWLLALGTVLWAWGDLIFDKLVSHI